MSWAAPCEIAPGGARALDEHDPYVIQFVRQVNYGPLEERRYLAASGSGFVELTEDALIQANFHKVNSYKNYKCNVHGKFFKLNQYQKDPFNKHHWRVNLVRPGSQIDI